MRLSVTGAHIVRHGTIIEPADLTLEGHTLGLVGAVEWLGALARGDARLCGGQVELDGIPVADAGRDGALGIADPTLPLPAHRRVREFLRASSLIGGAGRRRARLAPTQALATIGAATMAQRKIGTLRPPERALLRLAYACLSERTPVLAVEPLLGLEGGDTRAVLDAIGNIAGARGLVVVLGSIDGDASRLDLVRRCDQLALVPAGGATRYGPTKDVLAGARRFSVTVTRNTGALARELAARHIQFSLVSSAHPDWERLGARLYAELPEGGSTRAIVQAAHAARAPLVELLPA